MNCTDARKQIERAARTRATHDDETWDHLWTCDACRDFHDDLLFDAVIRETDAVPPPRESFVDEVITSAVTSAAHRHQQFITMAASIAAVAFAALALVLFTTSRVSQTVTIAAHHGKTVRMLIDSPTDEEVATLTIELGDNLELVGYPNDRRVQWQTSLSKGKNLLALPLKLTADSSSQFKVTLLRDSAQDQVSVRVQPEVNSTNA